MARYTTPSRQGIKPRQEATYLLFQTPVAMEKLRKREGLR